MYWSSWADRLSQMNKRNPLVSALFVEDLQREEPQAQSVSDAVLCAELLQSEGMDVPGWYHFLDEDFRAPFPDNPPPKPTTKRLDTWMAISRLRRPRPRFLDAHAFAAVGSQLPGVKVVAAWSACMSSFHSSAIDAGDHVHARAVPHVVARSFAFAIASRQPAMRMRGHARRAWNSSVSMCPRWRAQSSRCSTQGRALGVD